VRALRARDSDSPALARYDEIARILTGNPHACAEDAEGWLRELTTILGVPRLASYGVRASDVEAIADQARHANSMKGNPIVLTDEELAATLAAAL